MTNKGKTLETDDPSFSEAFFYCYDYLNSLKKEELDILKSDINMHCKITMFDTIKLDIITRNPSLLHLPGMLKIF